MSSVRLFSWATALIFSMGMGGLAQAQSGRLSASPSPCYAPQGSLCTAYIQVQTWQNRSYALTVTSRNEGIEKLMACPGHSETETAPWISPGDDYTFRLYETWGDCSAYNWRGNLVDTLYLSGIAYGGNPGNGGGGGGNYQHHVTIRANIDKTYDIYLRGNQAYFQLIEGADGVYNQYVDGYLPNQPVYVTASARTSGPGYASVYVIEQPSYQNNNTLHLRVTEASSGRWDVSVDLTY